VADVIATLNRGHAQGQFDAMPARYQESLMQYATASDNI
jgi:hypothetical protein